MNTTTPGILIVHRQPKGAIPAPVEYSLTDYGRSVSPLVEDVRLWGRAHMEHQSRDMGNS
jgi:DNA-binding HxlR family transcriptional regulator